MDRFAQAMQRRFACKVFDPARKLGDREFAKILEYGRLSPSSFGMEPWRFIVVTGQETKEALRPLCWNQKQITTCSHLLIIVADNGAVQDESYIEAMFARRGLSADATAAYIERYKSFLAQQDIACWTQKQCYIAAANMMTGAAYHGIESCPIEGFEKEKVEAFFELPAHQEVALLIAFGHCAMERPQKHRLGLEKLIIQRR